MACFLRVKIRIVIWNDSLLCFSLSLVLSLSSNGVAVWGLVMVCRRIAKMAWYTISDVKHSNSFLLSRRLEVIAISDRGRPRLITVIPKARSLLVVLVQPLQRKVFRKVSGSESRHTRRSGHEVDSGMAICRSRGRSNRYRCQDTLDAIVAGTS